MLIKLMVLMSMSPGKSERSPSMDYMKYGRDSLHLGLEPIPDVHYECLPICQCDFNLLKEVRCDRAQLTNEMMHEVYMRSPGNLRKLSISNDQNRYFRNHFMISRNMKRLGQLKILELKNGKISSLDGGLLKRFKELEILDFTDNNVKQISSYSFGQLPKLKILRLGTNKIEALGPHTLSQLENLEELVLENNKITSISRGLLGLKRLRILNLAGNPLGDSLKPRQLAEVRNLEELDLSGCQIESLTGEMFKMTPKLRTLKLSRNFLTSFSPFLLPLIKVLESLDLSGNRLRDPIANHQFTGWALSNLNISQNPIGRYKLLTPLSLKGSNISVLNVSGCGFTIRDHMLFSVLRNQLTVLDMSKNVLRMFDTNVFGHYSVLSELYISQTNISRLPDKMSRNLTTVTALDLSNNGLKDIPSTFLAAFPELKSLDVSSNHLQTARDAQAVSRVCSVFLHKNPWVCDCDTQVLRDQLMNANLTHDISCPNPRYDLVKCSNPPRYEGLRILGFSENSVPTCSPIFGAAGLSHTSEIGILVGVGIAVLLIIFLTMAVICSYAWPKIRSRKKSVDRSVERYAIKLNDSPSEVGDFYGFSTRSYQKAFLDCNIMALYDDERSC